MKISWIFLGTFLWTSAAFGVPLHEDDFEKFLKRSKAHPGQVFVLKIGTTWCKYCVKESEDLKKHQKRGSIAEAYWNEVILDKDPKEDLSDKYEAFAKANGFPAGNSYPNNIVFKNGRPIGHLTGYNGLNDLESFISDAKAVLPSSRDKESKTTSFPKFPCGPNDSDKACVVAVSGFEGQSSDHTDDFGRANLASFAELFKNPEYAKLFSPPVPAVATRKASSGSNGVFYVRNPFLDSAERFADGKGSIPEIEDLQNTKGRNIRILLTGHGSPFGMTVGYEKTGSPPNQWNESVYLQQNHLTSGLTKARSSGKTVRAVVVQCYGGQYGEAFMPAQGNGSSGCAAFASLPEKQSEGCYSNEYTGEREDYLGQAMRLKKCDGRQDARDLHYAIVSELKGHDVPMLSSEYFLLFGPAAKKLGANSTGPAPRGSIIKAQAYANGEAITLYFDTINNRVLKTVGERNQLLPNPELQLLDCVRNDWKDYDGIDFAHTGFSFLRERISGQFASSIGDCKPKFRAKWPGRPDLSTITFNTSAYGNNFFNPQAVGDPNNSHAQSANFKELSPQEKMIDISDLKPEARVLISQVLPHFYNYMSPEQTAKELERLANEVRPHNPSQADAILHLTREASKNKNHPLTSRNLTGLMFQNLGDADVATKNIAGSRLAHLVMAAIAELRLRWLAKQDPAAADLVRQLDQMKECEKDIL